MRAAIVLFISCLWSLASAAHQPRFLNFEPGVKIASRLTRADRAVLIEKNLPPLGVGRPADLPVQEMLEGYTIQAAAVLVVRLRNRQSVLTPPADWIVTRFKGQILEQLKPSPLTLRVDDFVIQTEGGLINIGRTRVEADAYWERKLRTDRTYLVFPESRRWPVSDVIAYEIDSDGRLRNTTPEFDPETATDNLHGFPFADARKIILATPPRGRAASLVLLRSKRLIV